MKQWLTPQAHDRLRSELAVLRDLLDAAPTDDDNEAVVRRARQARVQRIHDLLLNSVVGETPPDDGIAEPGMVLTVRYDNTGDVETFLLGARDAEYGDVEVYSMHSPLGMAILGARTGERRTYEIPSGATVPVTLLAAVPYGMQAPAAATPG